MPTISLRYSSNITGIDFPSVLSEIHSLLVEHCDAKLMACKGTIQAMDQFLIGDGSAPEQAFILIHVALLSGRTDEQKEQFITALTHLATEKLSTTPTTTCQVRLRFEELTRDQEYYFLAN